jgi:hypothetical protein
MALCEGECTNAALPAAFFWLPAIGTPSNDALQFDDR